MTPFEEYKEKWLQLDMLCFVGKDDSAEADALRDEMAPLFYKLTEEDKQAINALAIEIDKNRE